MKNRIRPITSACWHLQWQHLIKFVLNFQHEKRKNSLHGKRLVLYKSHLQDGATLFVEFCCYNTKLSWITCLLCCSTKIQYCFSIKCLSYSHLRTYLYITNTVINHNYCKLQYQNVRKFKVRNLGGVAVSWWLHLEIIFEILSLLTELHWYIVSNSKSFVFTNVTIANAILVYAICFYRLSLLLVLWKQLPCSSTESDSSSIITICKEYTCMFNFVVFENILI